MNGMAVIRHATRRLPEVIQEVLARNQISAARVAAFVMHQANQNLIERVARHRRAGRAFLFEHVA